MTEHGPFWALKAEDGRIHNEQSPEVYLLAQFPGPFALASAKREGLTPVRVMLVEMPSVTVTPTHDL